MGDVGLQGCLDRSDPSAAEPVGPGAEGSPNCEAMGSGFAFGKFG